MPTELDQILAYHCAPALAGIKPACLVSCVSTLGNAVRDYNAAFNRKGIFLRVLCQCKNRVLLLVYRPDYLVRVLSDPEVRLLLNRAGYPAAADLELLLKRLSLRLERQRPGEFPHEVGLFLGYPPADVAGFWRHRGQNYKLCGYWKVYSDEALAQARFAAYDRCRAALCRKVAAGVPLVRLFRAA